MKKIFIVFAFVLLKLSSFGQTSVGTIVGNFELQDIYGNTHNLYDYLNQGKTVVINIDATWNGPGWYYFQTNALNDIYAIHGTSGSDDAVVLFVEGDNNTTIDDLIGWGSNTQGDWISGANYPIIDANTNDVDNIIGAGLEIPYYPVMYVICPNRMITASGVSGVIGNVSNLNDVINSCPSSPSLAVDPAIVSYNGTLTSCGLFDVIITIQNQGTTPLTNCSFNVQGIEPIINFQWSGFLNTYEVETIYLGSGTASNVNEAITISVSSEDGDLGNSTWLQQLNFVNSLETTSVPSLTTFEEPNFPYNNWRNENEDNAIGWTTLNLNDNQQNVLYIDTYSYDNIGQLDHIITAPYDFSTTNQPSLSFKVANRRYNSNYYDKLIVSVATNCDGPWNLVWMKQGSELATGPDFNSGSWGPSVPEDWRTECIDLAAYAGANSVFVRFTNENYYGNNVFIDDISVQNASCSSIVFGCTDFNACNFNPDANTDDGSCLIASVEICDGADNDCDGIADNGLLFEYWYADYDNDGIGNYWDNYYSCAGSPGYVNIMGDCDDFDPLIATGTPEVCDDIDNDCNGITDDGLTFQNWYEDIDGDGIGNYWNYYYYCTNFPGYVAITGDCNDYNPAVGTGSAEVCDGFDNDCDGYTDEDLYQYWFADNDGDNYGSYWNYGYYCEAPIGFVNTDGDCNDNNNTIFFSAPELCDGLDNNCEGNYDEGISEYFFEDADGDGFGSWNGIYTCNPPANYVNNSSDCDDNNADWNTFIEYFFDIDGDGFGGPESQNFCETPPSYYVDNSLDCFPSIITYADSDGDGFGTNEMTACGVTNFFDCEDNDANVSPNAIEICDALDNDCDGVADDGLSQNVLFFDNDGDGYGGYENIIVSCNVNLPNYTTNSGDCNDGNTNVNPGEIEIPNNAIDENCDGNLVDVTGVSDNNEGEITLFPNPSINFIDINNLNGPTKLTVTDLSGRVIYQYSTVNTRHTIDCLDWNSGYYLIQIQTALETTVMKFEIIK